MFQNDTLPAERPHAYVLVLRIGEFLDCLVVCRHVEHHGHHRARSPLPITPRKLHGDARLAQFLHLAEHFLQCKLPHLPFELLLRGGRQYRPFAVVFGPKGLVELACRFGSPAGKTGSWLALLTKRTYGQAGLPETRA